MLDPLSIIGGVIAVATAGIQSSREILKLVDNMRSCPDDIVAVSSDVQAFYSVVLTLRTMLEDDAIHAIMCDDAHIIAMMENLTRPLGSCEAVLKQLTVKINNSLKSDDRNKFRISSRKVKWGLFTKAEVKRLQLRLEATKSTLNSALDSITTYAILTKWLAQGKANGVKTLQRTLIGHGQSHYFICETFCRGESRCIVCLNTYSNAVPLPRARRSRWFQ